jgi:hypothetical protein
MSIRRILARLFLPRDYDTWRLVHLIHAHKAEVLDLGYGWCQPETSLTPGHWVLQQLDAIFVMRCMVAKGPFGGGERYMLGQLTAIVNLPDDRMWDTLHSYLQLGKKYKDEMLKHNQGDNHVQSIRHLRH